jgi:hypothetical protein
MVRVCVRDPNVAESTQIERVQVRRGQERRRVIEDAAEEPRVHQEIAVAVFEEQARVAEESKPGGHRQALSSLGLVTS